MESFVCFSVCHDWTRERDTDTMVTVAQLLEEAEWACGVNSCVCPNGIVERVFLCSI